VGLFGFGVRGGVDFRRSGQFVMGATLDLGDLFTNRIRLRPSAEIGVFNGPNSYVGNFEALWRFTDDEEVATPYIGLGVGLAGRDGCGTDPACPGVWLNTVFGFALHVQLAARVPRHGPDAAAPAVHRTDDTPGQLTWRRPLK
jgi:hypothetical protein